MRIALYLICILYGLSSWSVPPADPDLGWHLFGGAWILEHGKLPDFDPINTFSPGWQDYHWLAQLFMIEVYKLGSYPLLQCVFGLVLAYTAKVLVDVVLLYSPKDFDPIRALLVALLAVYCIHAISSPRPQMIAILGLALALRRVSGPQKSWELLYLFLLTAVLANCHVYWIFIPFLFLCFRVIPQISSHTITQCFILCLAGMVSPYTTASYALLIDYLLIPASLRSTIFELRPGLSGDGFLPYAILVFCLLAFLLRDWKTEVLPRRGAFVAFLASLFMTFRALKFFSVLAITSLPITTPALYRLFEGRRFSLKVQKLLLGGFSIHAFYFCAITCPWVVDSSQIVKSLIPVEACTKIAQMPLAPSHGRNHIRLMTHFNHGGWCRWIIYQNNPALDVRVTTDGRTQWVPERAFQDSFGAYLLGPAWMEVLGRWKPDAVLVPKNNPLGQVLSRSPDWKIEAQDDVFGVLLPRAEAVPAAQN
ncbi:MAG: hypothetical protein J0M12_14365 [Deltaproteobacteria bacterium]|nr:hypothetical protein [Deltaproteobacteria bacterium]